MIYINFAITRCDCFFCLFQSGIDITKILSAKKKLEAKRKRHEEKTAKKAKKTAKKNAVDMVRMTGEIIFTVTDTKRSENVLSLIEISTYSRCNCPLIEMLFRLRNISKEVFKHS